MQGTKILSPVKPEVHRLNFEKPSIDVTQMVVKEAFKPLIDHFSRIAIGRYFWVIIDLAHWITEAAGVDLKRLTPL